MADRFDFCSAAFDPLAALLAACVRPPVPGARPLDNLHKCRWLLPEGHPDALRDQPVAPVPAQPALDPLDGDRGLLIDVEAALKRLEQGTYGRCVATGRPIAEERLRLFPWVRNA